VRITPSGQQSVFYQGPPGFGLSTALGVLKRGYVIVGYVPSTDGTSATAQPGGIVVLSSSGKVLVNPTDPKLLDGPWDMTIADSGRTAKVFIANVLSGTVSRFDIKITASGPQSTRAVQIASGYIHRGDPAAFEIGPTGLVFNAKSNTLYVASTGNNAIYAIRGAGTTKADRGTGRIVYQDSAHLHGPLGMTIAPDGNLIAAQGDAINSDPNQPSELVEFTTKGKFIGQFSISTAQGGAFGVATSSTGRQFAAVNDNTNSVEIWPVRP
jgi:DNA-binding beta-propeller fold protein YncE